MKRFASVSIVEIVVYGAWVVFAVMIAVAIYINVTTPQPSAIEVFSARFDECMATEQFTREECIAYADEGE